MGLMRISVRVKAPNLRTASYEGFFLIDTGAIDSIVPTSAALKAGIRPIGHKTFELADGTRRKYRFGAAQFEFMGEVTVGRVIFGPENTEPILGATALESAGILIDPLTQTLKRLPPFP